MAKQACMCCYISGRVQGVWFRASTKEQAERLRLNGWARNLPDGRVEVLACGDENRLNLLYEWLKQGPQLAIVHDCSREDIPWQNYEGFHIK
ncbi:acylphosphatase [Legionella oakridgensis]|uniref:Acylphosphatase n=2 Tax=Legionella oakridgensis TaxID=29423 RepID=W0BGE2_9GAMM|nr:acylphosphatase [Legionella oakridgensis]AHE67746.1 acylphosphatase [Legionella oakridgensis ATCC 33761 = DSM 21215]ETO92707.1 acylphosphatase [Legionella oakridgensis RV-2-2007]KTD36926.1 acylphosphatase [Legionella oakridgensis]STY20765.1 acylphosphatase [Legionella longbeachae]